jgi:hypothetical protein
VVVRARASALICLSALSERPALLTIAGNP